MTSRFGAFRRLLGNPSRASWRDLVRDPNDPRRTVLGFGVGTLIGATPILGVHTWACVTIAPLLRVPVVAVLLGSNISNPITFVPITLVEIRVGQWLLGRPFSALPSEFTAQALGLYVLEAWMGFLVVGPVMVVMASFAMWVALEWRRRRKAASPGSVDSPVVRPRDR